MTDLPSSITAVENDEPHIYEEIDCKIDRKLNKVYEELENIKVTLAKNTPKHDKRDSANVHEHGNQAKSSKSHNQHNQCEACSEIPQTVGSRYGPKGSSEWHFLEERIFERVDRHKSKENSVVMFKNQWAKVLSLSRNKTHNDINKDNENSNCAEKKVFYEEVHIDKSDEKINSSPASSESDAYSETNGTLKVKLPPDTQEQVVNTAEIKLSNPPFDRGALGICVNKNTAYEHAINQQNEGPEHKSLQNELSIFRSPGCTTETIEQEMILAYNPKRPIIKLILFGFCGYGKSSTINSLMGFPCINTSSKLLRTKHEPVLISTTVNGIILLCIDTPGIEETKNSAHLESIYKSLHLFNYNFSCLLLVLKYGELFTQQCKSIVKSLKGILGDKVIEDCCVCVITNGDQFTDDMRCADEQLSLVEWCRQQDAQTGMFFQECQYRCVLFDNKTKDESKMKTQFNKLMSVVKTLRTYTKSDFQSITKEREAFLVKCSMPLIRKKKQTKILVNFAKK